MFAFLFVIWIVFNGKITLEIALVGIVVCLLICLFAWKFLSYDFKRELKLVKKLPVLICYFGIMVKEIFISNIIVMKMILTGKKVHPVLYHFTTDLRHDTTRVILSHSITLTPGTITVELKDDQFVVHCLDTSLAEGMEDSSIVKILRKLEG